MSIYSLKNKVLKEEKDWSNDDTLELDLEIEFDKNNDPIFYTDNHLIILKEYHIKYPSIHLEYIKHQKVDINIVPDELNDKKAPHRSRIKILGGTKSVSLTTRSLTFANNNSGDVVPTVSEYQSQKNKNKKFKTTDSDGLLKPYMIDAAFSFVQSNPELIKGFIDGKYSFYDVTDYAENEYNKLSDKEKEKFAKQIEKIK